jgi:hypothetical protein
MPSAPLSSSPKRRRVPVSTSLPVRCMRRHTLRRVGGFSSFFSLTGIGEVCTHNYESAEFRKRLSGAGKTRFGGYLSGFVLSVSNGALRPLDAWGGRCLEGSSDQAISGGYGLSGKGRFKWKISFARR